MFGQECGMNRGRQWKAEDILATGRLFMQSRILISAVELELFQPLCEKEWDAGELARQKKLDQRALAMLLDALTALGFLEKSNGKYRVPDSGRAFLSESSEESVLPMLRHAGNMWKRWSNLTEVVRTGQPQLEPVTRHQRTDGYQSFILAMHVVGQERAEHLAETIDLSGVNHFLDVGGASGTYTIAFLEKKPGMKATLFDLPPAIPLARERLQKENKLDRVTLCPGDFYQDDLPKGHDLALLSAIIHQNSREQNRALYKKVFHALNADGRILIRDHVMEPDRTNPPGGAVFAINMLTGTEGGGTYTFDEIREDLESAGFTQVTLLEKDQTMNGVVEARRV
jgi:hypothetical protein